MGPTPRSEVMAQYRARIKEDPVKWAAYLKAQREYKRAYYQKTKAMKDEERRFKGRIRQRRYRERKKLLQQQDPGDILKFECDVIADEAADSAESFDTHEPLTNFALIKNEIEFPAKKYETTVIADAPKASPFFKSQCVQTEENEMMTFFKSLIPDCNKLCEKRKRTYKFEILKRLNEHLDQQESDSFLMTYCGSDGYANQSNLPDDVDVKPTLI